MQVQVTSFDADATSATQYIATQEDEGRTRRVRTHLSESGWMDLLHTVVGGM